MNNNIPTGLSCNWNGQRWTPTVTNLQDQWAAQTPPGIARGKVWQPKAAPPPPTSVTSVDIDDISDDHLEEVVASGFPLDLSTFRSGGSPSRHVESPLDLSLKTRKRCADSTIRCQQYGQSGKKMCLSSRDILIHQDNVDTVTSHNYMHAQELHHNDTLSRDYHPNSVSRDSHPSNVSRDSHPSNVSRDSHNSRHHIHHIDPMVLKHDYTSSNQHLQNIHKVQHSNKVYAQDSTEVRYTNQAISRPYPKPSNQQVSHHHISIQKMSQQRTEISKYYPVNIPREREFSGGDPSKYFRQDVLSTNPGISPLVRSADNYHVIPQVQKALSSTSTPTLSRYLGSHSTNDSYDYLRNSPAVSYNQIVTSSRSPALHQNRPSVLSGGLQFKQPQECCSPDSTFVVNSPAEPQSHSSCTSRGSTANSDVVSRDAMPRRQLEKCDLSKGNRVSSTSYSSRGSNVSSAGVLRDVISRDCSSTSYTPSTSPRCGFFSNSPNMISSRKSPSNKSVSKLTSSGSNIPDSTPIMQHVSNSRSIIMGTSGSISKDCTSETVIRNPRPRLWNPNQSKQNLWKFQEETFQGGNGESISNISNKLSEHHASSNVSERKVVSDVSGKTEFNGPLEIAFPTAKTLESKTESKPKPFSKKHIIMNAFRNDESMKHILEEQKVAKPLQTAESARNTVIAQDKVVRSQDSGVFISPESPKMPTLSPQQKLPAPKVSPLMVEPPTLDLASSQGNRRRQNKVSPSRKTQLKHAFEGGQHNEKQDYSIQPHSSFPQRPKLPYKKIPIANVAPMIHGKCNSTEIDSDKLNQDFKQFVSIPTPQPIQAFRVSASIVNQKETQDFDIKEHQSDAHLVKSYHSKTKCEKISSKKITHKSTTKNNNITTENSKQLTSKETDDRNKSASLDLESKTEVSSNVIHKDKDCRNTSKNANSNDKTLKERTIINPRRKSKYPQRKTKIISNTKRKADEIRRRAIERKYKGCLSGCTSMKMRRLRKRFHMVKPRGFIDFQPEVLETRTRRKSAGRRVYHRNAAYEDELWREEKRKAVRHRQRVRRFNKRLSLKGKVSNTEVTKTIPEVTTESLPVPVTDTTESKEEDNSGTWEVKNTSTMLRNGKSKGALSMKLLFRPQERRRFRRRMRKRGKIRYGLRKAVPRRSKLVPYNPVVQHGLSQSMTPLSKELNGQEIDVHSMEYSGYDFDTSERIEDACPVPYIPYLPEVKKLSVCKDTGETILHRAARMGYTDAALSYLQTGTVDVNVRDNAGYTPLHESCVSGNMKIARMLLSYGAMVNCASQDGIRPIHDAVDNDFVSLVRLLLSYGADPTISTYGGKTPIKIAHSKKMKSLIQGYLGDINGFNEDSEQSCWEFQILENEATEGDDIFSDIPSDPEIEPEEEVFQESSIPLFNQYTVNESISTEGLCVVLLKDVSDFLHIKTADIIKDKSIKSVLIEDAKDMIQTSSECSFYQERIQNVIETNCRLLPVKDLHLVFSKFEKKKTLDKEKKAAAAEKICDHGTLTGEKSAIEIPKSPKHKTFNSRSHHDI